MNEGQQKPYIVITGDIIASRKEQAESRLNRIPELLEEFNVRFAPLSGFTLSAGDEIQGLIDPRTGPFNLLLELTSILYPLRVKFGIGFGGLSTEIKPNIGEMRGAAFEYARTALESLPANNRVLYRIGSSDNNQQQTTNTILMLLSRIVDAWDDRVFRRHRMYKEEGNAQRVAEKEGVSTEAINKHLNAYSIRETIETLAFLDKMIIDISTHQG